MKQSKRDMTSFNIGQRLAQLRLEKGLTQGQFCDRFTEFTGCENKLTNSSVSSWEQNRRTPTIETLINLASFYGVSCDYLFGITDERNATGGREKQGNVREIMSHADTPLKHSDLPNYNGMPVFIKFKNNTHLNQWGILDCSKKRVICKDFAVSLTIHIECYPYAIQEPVRTQITSYQKLIATEYVWIKMQTSDSEICGLYNGRYKHNENRTALVKLDNGLMLPYSGLDIAFWAFRG
jgi:transcriptional regulator with XRE-family HTH domain